MDKLNTGHLQGWPITLDDLENIIESYSEGFKGLISAFGLSKTDSFILSGCGATVNGANYDIAAGYICLEGEVYKVDAHSISTTNSGSNVHQWAVIETNDPESQDNDLQGNSFYKNKIRQAHVVDAAPGSGYMKMAADTIHDKIAQLNQLETQKPEWITIPDSAGWNKGGPGNVARYSKDAFGNVEIQLSITVTGANVNIVTLPVGYRIGMATCDFLIDSSGLQVVSVLDTGVVKCAPLSPPILFNMVIKYRADL